VSVWNIFSLIGGLAIFIYGIILMNKNFTSIAGDKMKLFMLTLTKSRPRGYLTGCGITIINQSSSATTVLEATLVSAGLMTFYQSVAVTMGAELGSTFLAHIIALPGVKQLAPVIVAGGLSVSLAVKKQKVVNIAYVVLGLGLLFLGLGMMIESVKPLRESPFFLDFMKRIEVPILGIIFGAVFAGTIHSSGAVCGLTIALVGTGAMTLEQAIPINVGATIGTVVTVVIAGFALNWEAKRTAFWHVLSQLAGGIFAYILLIIYTPEGERVFIWLTKWLTATVFRTDDAARQIAVGFTLVPMIKAIIFFGIPKFLNTIIALFDKVLPPRESEKPFSVKYLHEKLAEANVDIALEMAKKEILVAADLVKDMFGKIDLAFKNKDLKLINEIHDTDTKVDTLHKTIIPFLAKISGKELGEEESKRSINYLYIENELESIGDILDKNLIVMAKKMIDNNLSFSEQGSQELTELHGKVVDNINRMVTAIREEDVELAKNIKEIDVEESKYQQSHIKRLNQGLKISIDTSSIHLDVISYYARINESVAFIANRIIWLKKKHI